MQDLAIFPSRKPYPQFGNAPLFCVSVDAAKVVLVTGASRGIGFAIAKRLSREGYIVYAGKRTTSALQFLSPLQKKYPDNLFMIDITGVSHVQEWNSVLNFPKKNLPE
jgi:NADP-dependent 3-hydroxy acid dehydrogenase YdfG